MWSVLGSAAAARSTAAVCSTHHVGADGRPQHELHEVEAHLAHPRVHLGEGVGAGGGGVGQIAAGVAGALHVGQVPGHAAATPPQSVYTQQTMYS